MGVLVFDSLHLYAKLQRIQLRRYPDLSRQGEREVEQLFAIRVPTKKVFMTEAAITIHPARYFPCSEWAEAKYPLSLGEMIYQRVAISNVPHKRFTAEYLNPENSHLFGRNHEA